MIHHVNDNDIKTKYPPFFSFKDLPIVPDKIGHHDNIFLISS